MASNRNNDIGKSNCAEVIKSIKDTCEISIDGFLYIKDKNHDDVHYWICEYKLQKKTKCTAKATTIRTGNQQKIQKFYVQQHNHAPETSKPEVLKVCIPMKKLGQITNDQPARTINDVITTISREL